MLSDCRGQDNLVVLHYSVLLLCPRTQLMPSCSKKDFYCNRQEPPGGGNLKGLKLTMLKNRRKDWAFFGVKKDIMASTLHAIGVIPFPETICPKKLSRFWPNYHLAALMINPLGCRRSNTCRRCVRCISMEDENIKMSSNRQR